MENNDSVVSVPCPDGAQPTPPDDILTPDEAATLLRISYFRVTSLARQRKIPATKVGGSWRFSRTALERYVREGGTANERKGAAIP